ncbi:hypothetical protein [Kordia sp.]|uniref:hypothetical protein n=1 Tax=Kordia sp. TaxID=1965332 RepID=UPI0025C13F08|nr:hypothetical protein [Kordia sp.]MCH2194300.1 hypothetical protein [Kordia sp.]
MTKVEFTTYNPKGEEVGAGKTFLKNGKLVRRDHKTFTNGKVTYEFRVKFQYDENGQVHTIQETNEDGEVKKYTYKYLEFDDQNNWIKRLDYVDDISETPQKLVTRTYTYYEK